MAVTLRFWTEFTCVMRALTARAKVLGCFTEEQHMTSSFSNSREGGIHRPRHADDHVVVSVGVNTVTAVALSAVLDVCWVMIVRCII